MLKYLFNILQKNNKPNPNFFELKSSERKKIIKKVVREANQEQSDLVKKYNEKFGAIKNCKI